jgi:hypothetical protein
MTSIGIRLFLAEVDEEIALMDAPLPFDLK